MYGNGQTLGLCVRGRKIDAPWMGLQRPNQMGSGGTDRGFFPFRPMPPGLHVYPLTAAALRPLQVHPNPPKQNEIESR